MRFLHRSRLLAAVALMTGICLLGAERNACAQGNALQEDALRRTWADFGGGLATSFRAGNAEGGFGILAGLNHQRGASLFSTRVAVLASLGDTGRRDAGLLYGRVASWSWGSASASAGLAYTWGEVNGEEEMRTLGVPLQTQIYVGIPYLPLGAHFGGFANLNAGRFFGGLTYGIVLGDLW